MTNQMVLSKLGQKLLENDEKKLIKLCNYGLQVEIFQRNQLICKKLATVIKTKSKQAFKAVKYYESVENAKRDWCYDHKKKIYKRTYVSIEDLFDKIERRTILFCNNKNCGKRFDLESKYLQHRDTCALKEFSTTIKYKQQKSEPDDIGLKLLKDLGFNHCTKHFMVFDVECMTSSDTINKRNHQTLVSISAQCSWEDTPMCFIREDSNIQSGIELVKKFLAYAHQRQNYFEGEFCQHLTPFREQLESFGEKSISINYEINRAKATLDNLSKLLIFSFNGERYDSPVLYPYLAMLMGERGENVNIIKRGSGLMSISTSSLRFGDCINFVGKMSLRKFSTTFSNQILDEKGIFPHQRYHSIEEIKNDSSFPQYHTFGSDLSKPGTAELERYIYKIFLDDSIFFNSEIKQIMKICLMIKRVCLLLMIQIYWSRFILQ